MSSLAFPHDAARRRGHGGMVRTALARAGADTLLAVALLILATVLLLEVPAEFSVDSWLALVTGREVWQSGVPHHETLIALAYGHQWLDQQWLSQVFTYAIYRIGGLGLLGLVNVAFLVGGVAGATVAARRRGAPFLAVLVTLPLCVALITPSREVRTQTFVIPLFVGVAYLLAQDARAPSRRVYWCLPLLVLWANLHGTVTLGAGLVGLRGLTVAWERRDMLLSSARSWIRPLALAGGAVASILVTPYGLSIISYYRTTMVGGSLRQAVSEWQPATSEPALAAVLFVVAGVAVWSFGRHPSRTTLWERMALIVLAAGSISVVRNCLFLGLFALMVVPVSLGFPQRAVRRIADRSRSINGALLAGAVVLALAAAAATMIRPAATIELSYQRIGVLRSVQLAIRQQPSLRILADERFDDWLVWRDPSLGGRIAADARFELLSPGQLGRLEGVFSVVGSDWKLGARGDRLLVLDRKYDPGTVKGFLAEPGRRVLYDDGQRLVILRSAAQAERG